MVMTTQKRQKLLMEELYQAKAGGFHQVLRQSASQSESRTQLSTSMAMQNLRQIGQKQLSRKMSRTAVTAHKLKQSVLAKLIRMQSSCWKRVRYIRKRRAPDSLRGLDCYSGLFLLELRVLLYCALNIFLRRSSSPQDSLSSSRLLALSYSRSRMAQFSCCRLIVSLRGIWLSYQSLLPSLFTVYSYFCFSPFTLFCRIYYASTTFFAKSFKFALSVFQGALQLMSYQSKRLSLQSSANQLQALMIQSLWRQPQAGSPLEAILWQIS